MLKGREEQSFRGSLNFLKLLDNTMFKHVYWKLECYKYWTFFTMSPAITTATENKNKQMFCLMPKAQLLSCNEVGKWLFLLVYAFMMRLLSVNCRKKSLIAGNLNHTNARRRVSHCLYGMSPHVRVCVCVLSFTDTFSVFSNQISVCFQLSQ